MWVCVHSKHRAVGSVRLQTVETTSSVQLSSSSYPTSSPFSLFPFRTSCIYPFAWFPSSVPTIWFIVMQVRNLQCMPHNHHHVPLLSCGDLRILFVSSFHLYSHNSHAFPINTFAVGTGLLIGVQTDRGLIVARPGHIFPSPKQSHRLWRSPSLSYISVPCWRHCFSIFLIPHAL